MVSSSENAQTNLSSRDQPGRPEEIEDWLNRTIYHPLSKRIAYALLPTAITPNMVSAAGVLVVWAAAFAYTELTWPYSVMLGFALHAFWHVVDGADGDLARLSGRNSLQGELIDGICDYLGHVVLYVALTFYLAGQIGPWAWAIVVAAGASHAIQTSHAQIHRRLYLWWVYDRKWLLHAASENMFDRRNNWLNLIFGRFVTDYLRIARITTPMIEEIEQLISEPGDDRNRERLRRLARAKPVWMLRYHNITGPNLRALALAFSMAFRSPLWYFLFEIILLNIVLILSIMHHRAIARRIVAALKRGRQRSMPPAAA